MRKKKKKKKVKGGGGGGGGSKLGIRTWKKFLVVEEACMAIFWPGFNVRKFASFGFSIEGTIISASAAPLWGNILKTVVVVVAVDTTSNRHPVTIHCWVNLGTAVCLKGIGLLKTKFGQQNSGIRNVQCPFWGHDQLLFSNVALRHHRDY